MNESQLSKRFPKIEWEKPILVHVTNGDKGFGCRYCIALYGLHAKEVFLLPQSITEFKKHMSEKHGIKS